MPNFEFEDVFGNIDDIKKVYIYMLIFYFLMKITLIIIKLLISDAIDKDAKFDEMERRIENIEKYCDVYKNDYFIIKRILFKNKKYSSIKNKIFHS